MDSVYLENKIVQLKPMEIEDVEEIFKAACFDEIWTHMPITVKNREDVIKYVESALSLKKAGVENPFVIIDTLTNKIIGATKLMDISEQHKRGEIGFTWLTPNYWRTSINTNCKYLLLTYCFEKLGWQRVQIKTDHENIRSQKAIERIGAKKEGVLRNHMIRKDGTIRHTVMFSITSDEWTKEVKVHLENLLEK
ncbi:N-acetyltransferase [Lysinibacillus sp. PLM2]|nr:N-acetyltransferase [Lysinibacillus sp. PLM2]